MPDQLTFATAEQIQAYNVLSGATNALTPKADGSAFTTTEIEQANFRGNRHIRIHWFGNFKPEFQGATLADIPEDVQCALQEAVSIAASKELETPQFFTSALAPQTEQQLKSLGALELYEKKTGNTATEVHTSRGQEADIGDLLDKYLLVPRIEQNACPVSPTDGTGSIAGGIMGVTARCK